jgi:6-phosphogluconolactonase
MQILEFNSKDEWIDAVMEKLLDVVAYDSELMIGLAGGNTPKDIYQRLGLSILDRNTWSKLNFVIIDERDVAYDHKASNYGMIKSYLKQARIFFFETELENKSLIVKKMDRNLRLHKQGKYFFDLLILGMGEDGHVASIFKGFNRQKFFNEKFLSTYTKVPGNEFENRFSLTFSALNSAKEAILLVKGKEKIDMLKLMKQGDYQLHDENEFPIVSLLKNVPTVIFALSD